MPRGRPAERREVRPDYLLGSRYLGYLINCLMQGGKKGVAEKTVYAALSRVQERADGNPLEVYDRALKNVCPSLEVKGRRVGGRNYPIPIEVRPERRLSLGTRWLISSAKARPGKSMAEKLSDEILDAANNTGSAVRRKEETHRMAEANRAFAHYRW